MQLIVKLLLTNLFALNKISSPSKLIETNMYENVFVWYEYKNITFFKLYKALYTIVIIICWWIKIKFTTVKEAL